MENKSDNTYQDKVKSWHDKYAKDYTHPIDERYNSLLELDIEGKNLINFGASNGADTFPFLNQAMTIVGLDFSSKMIEEANKKNVFANAIFICHDFTKDIPYENSFDIAYSYSTMYYVKNPLSVLKNMYKALVPGGFAVIEMANSNSVISSTWDKVKFDVPQFHQTPSRMKSLLTKAGFTIIKDVRYKLHPLTNKKVNVLRPFAYKIVWVVQKNV